MSIIAVVGSKKSGKTTAIETLVRGLTKRGYRIATVKHIPEADFTIDTKGKDTWRHAKAGACIVVSVAPNELATIKKVDTTKYGLGEILRNVEEDVDITILEGFRKLIEQSSAVPKIVAAKTTDPDRLVDLVDKNVATSVEKRRKRREDIRIQIDGQLLPLTPFVQEFVRNTILAMVSTLRDTKIKGDEDLFVTIRRVSRHQ